MPSPDEVANVPAQTLVQFCEQRRDERRRFRHAVEDLIGGLRSIEDPHARLDHIADTRTEIEDSMRDLRDASEEFGIDKLHRAATIALPAVAGSVIAFTGDPLVAALATGVGYAIEFVHWKAESRGKKRTFRKDSDYHYLLSLEAAIGRSVVRR